MNSLFSDVQRAFSPAVVSAGTVKRTCSTEKWEGGFTVLWTIAVILLVLWLLGVVSGTTLNGFIYLLLVLAVVAVIIQLIQGRRAL